MIKSTGEVVKSVSYVRRLYCVAPVNVLILSLLVAACMRLFEAQLFLFIIDYMSFLGILRNYGFSVEYVAFYLCTKMFKFYQNIPFLPCFYVVWRMISKDVIYVLLFRAFSRLSEIEQIKLTFVGIGFLSLATNVERWWRKFENRTSTLNGSSSLLSQESCFLRWLWHLNLLHIVYNNFSVIHQTLIVAFGFLS